MKRKIINITSSGQKIFALCSDNTLWEKYGDQTWSQVQEIPESEEKETETAHEKRGK